MLSCEAEQSELSNEQYDIAIREHCAGHEQFYDAVSAAAAAEYQLQCSIADVNWRSE